MVFTRRNLDWWCERGILSLVLGMLAFAPLAFGAVDAWAWLVLQCAAAAAFDLWAERLWAPVGVTSKQDRRTQLDTLAEWFRSFEPGLPPEAGNDPLADLVLSKRGVCRHRALGFVVLAQSLGGHLKAVPNG